MRNPNEYDYRTMCFNAAVCVEQRLAEANSDGNTDVGIADPRVWLELVWLEWRKQLWRDAAEKAWTAPERVDALVELKVERGGSHD